MSNKSQSVVHVLTDVILHAIAEWSAEEEDTDLTIRIRNEILRRCDVRVRGTVTDAEVSAACSAYTKLPDIEFPDPTRMRFALEAAREARS